MIAAIKIIPFATHRAVHQALGLFRARSTMIARLGYCGARRNTQVPRFCH
jgi:hypothetical protein